MPFHAEEAGSWEDCPFDYLCHEFIAIDRALTPAEMMELEAVAPEAEISPVSLWAEYYHGDLQDLPRRILTAYFDAYFYYTDWGDRRLMLRLPADSKLHKILRPFFRGHPARLDVVGPHLVIDLWGHPPENDYGEPIRVRDWFLKGRFAALIPLRAALLQGDTSAAYLAWLLAVQYGKVPEQMHEPVVPVGLQRPNASLVAMIEILFIDKYLVAAAAEKCADASLRGHRTAGELRARAEELLPEEERAAKRRESDAFWSNQDYRNLPPQEIPF